MGDLSPHLVGEKERVLLEAVVEHEKVAEGGERHVEEPASHRGDGVEAEGLPQKILFVPGRRVHVRRQEVAVACVQDQIHSSSYLSSSTYAAERALYS